MILRSIVLALSAVLEPSEVSQVSGGAVKDPTACGSNVEASSLKSLCIKTESKVVVPGLISARDRERLARSNVESMTTSCSHTESRAPAIIALKVIGWLGFMSLSPAVHSVGKLRRLTYAVESQRPNPGCGNVDTTVETGQGQSGTSPVAQIG